jgi:hypothetical protein
LTDRAKITIFTALLVILAVSASGCVSIPIPSSLPVPNQIPIVNWFLV